MIRASSNALMVNTGRNSTSLSGYPGLSVVICVGREAVLSGQLRNNRSSDSGVLVVVTVIREQDWIQTGRIVRSTLVFPESSWLCWARIIKRDPKGSQA